MATLAHWRRHVNTSLLRNPVVADAMSVDAIERACKEHGHAWRQSFWCPATTLITFLLQVLHAEKTLRAGVVALFAQLAAQGQTDLPSEDASAYCQARIRLPAEVVTAMLRRAADAMRDLVNHDTAWLGRRVWVVDGSNASMPDTPDLQKAFPQPPGQKRGCGFPIAQFVAVFCWSTGAIRDVVTDSLRPNEVTLFRKLWHLFKVGDVVLADRAYGSFVDMARLVGRGVDCVFRLHPRRKVDFRKGTRLGRHDHLVIWQRPKRWLPSVGISKEAFERLPETLTVREIRIPKTARGFRSRTVVVVTTLLDPEEAPAHAICALYHDRWTAELNLRSLKNHLGMEILRGHTADVVQKEIAMHLLAYNLIRLLMWHAAREHGIDLHRLSFTGTLHRLRVVLPLMMRSNRASSKVLFQHLLAGIARDLLPYRPNRVEPRRVKRRPKRYSLLTHPRTHYKGRVDREAR